MARVTLELPERFGFSTEVQVYLSLVNYGGHLDNALLLTLVSEARVRFFQSLGYHESNVQGLSLVVGDMQAQYLSEAFHGETLRIDVAPRELSRCALDLVWRVSEASQGREVARGKTGLVFIDPASKRAATIPDAVRAQARAVLDSYRDGNGGSREGHVFNLGHGIHQDVPPEHAGVFVEAVQDRKSVV